MPTRLRDSRPTRGSAAPLFSAWQHGVHFTVQTLLEQPTVPFTPAPGGSCAWAPPHGPSCRSGRASKAPREHATLDWSGQGWAGRRSNAKRFLHQSTRRYPAGLAPHRVREDATVADESEREQARQRLVRVFLALMLVSIVFGATFAALGAMLAVALAAVGFVMQLALFLYFYFAR